MKWWLLICGAVLLGVLTATAHIGWLSFTQGVSDSVVTLTDDLPVRQSIVSHHPGLAAITLRAVSPFPPDDQVVTVILRDVATGNVVVNLSQTFGGSQGQCVPPCAPTDRGLRFNLPVQDDSADRLYVVEIATRGQPLTVAAHTLDVYSEGERLGAPSGGDLVFRLDYNGQVAATLASLARQIAAGRPGLAGEALWAPGLALAYLLTLTLVLRGAQSLFAQAGAETARRPSQPLVIESTAPGTHRDAEDPAAPDRPNPLSQ